MNIKDLTQAAKDYVLDENKMVDMQKRVKEAEEKFTKIAWDRRVTQEWLNRSYSI